MSHRTFTSIATGTPARKRLVAGGALAIAVGLALQGVTPIRPAGAAIEAPAAPFAGALPGSFADLVESVKPAVVNIAAITAATPASARLPQLQMPPGSPFEHFFREFQQRQAPGGPRPEGRSVGSGFIIDAAGHIVTNYHVVKGARELAVTLHDGRQLEARIVGFDEKTDLALLAVDTEERLPHVEFGDSDRARVGDWVVAVGNPFGLGGSVSAGIISARGRDIQSGPYDDFLQIDAPINRGSSGGPLFDRSGRLVGVNTAIYSPTGGNVGIGFAIPANLAREVIAELESTGRIERGWLGVQIQPVTEQIAASLALDTARGALVASVMPDSPAAAAGFEPGDVVLDFGGAPVESFRELPRLVASADAGDEVEVRIWRAGRSRTLDVSIGPMPGEERVARAAPAEDAGSTPRIGLMLATLTPQIRQQLGVDTSVDGVVIRDVERGGPAAERGLRPGDLILRVGSRPVHSPGDVIDAVRDAAGAEREAILLLVRRDGSDRYVTLPFDKA